MLGCPFKGTERPMKLESFKESNYKWIQDSEPSFVESNNCPSAASQRIEVANFPSAYLATSHHPSLLTSQSILRRRVEILKDRVS